MVGAKKPTMVAVVIFVGRMKLLTVVDGVGDLYGEGQKPMVMAVLISVERAKLPLLMAGLMYVLRSKRPVVEVNPVLRAKRP